MLTALWSLREVQLPTWHVRRPQQPLASRGKYPSIQALPSFIVSWHWVPRWTKLSRLCSTTSRGTGDPSPRPLRLLRHNEEMEELTHTEESRQISERSKDTRDQWASWSKATIIMALIKMRSAEENLNKTRASRGKVLTETTELEDTVTWTTKNTTVEWQQLKENKWAWGEGRDQ